MTDATNVISVDRTGTRDGADGADVVANVSLADGDVIRIASSTIESFAELQAHISNNASGHAVITLGAQVITITGVSAAPLTAAHFDFI